MKNTIQVVCDHCHSAIGITNPAQIGTNIGRDRILCDNCYEWEMTPSSF